MLSIVTESEGGFEGSYHSSRFVEICLILSMKIVYEKDKSTTLFSINALTTSSSCSCKCPYIYIYSLYTIIKADRGGSN